MLPTPAAAATENEIDLWVLCAELDSSAKRWWIAGFVVRLLGFGVGVISVLGWWVSAFAGVASVSASVVLAEIFALYFETTRGTAQSLRRKLEFLDSFGWNIAAEERSDILARVSARLMARVDEKRLEEPYFGSTRLAGAERGLENLTESTWWSKHLSETMRTVTIFIVAALITLSIIVLLVALKNVDDPIIRDAVSRIVTAALLLLFSLGLLRLLLGYHRFSQSAGRVETAASNAAKQPTIDLIDVVKLLHEYQVARAAAPVIPDQAWRIRRDRLNSLWKKYRRSS